MQRETSQEAYEYLKDSGDLSLRRWETYSSVYKFGPVTGGELATKMRSYEAVCPTAYRNVHSRLTELRDMGLVKELGTRECAVTKMQVILWDVTSLKIPRKLEKKKVLATRKEMVALLREYRALLEQCKKYMADNELEKAAKRLAFRLETSDLIFGKIE